VSTEAPRRFEIKAPQRRRFCSEFNVPGSGACEHP